MFVILHYFLTFAAMKYSALIILSAVILSSCGERKTERQETFTIETINRTTPVKDQGRSPLCWVYAMLATIESDRIMTGDSVNLSAAYVARTVLTEQAEKLYLTRSARDVSMRGMAPMLISAIMRNGLVPYDSYRTDANFNVVARRIGRLARNAAANRTGMDRLRRQVADMLDEAVRPLPRHVYMYRAEYTPKEFAHSVCAEGEYVSLTSFTHKPFYEEVILDVPDNREDCRFLNVPLDTMIRRVETALRSGRSVCWEGDISEPGFSFKKGTARLDKDDFKVTQEARQRAFETFRTTDDHCMALIGIARDSSGRRYFICKNSWGTDNPYHGLMFMSEDYLRMKTVAVVMKR